ncbi:MAG TPA: hypothetical protein VFK47_07615, partial [Ktedonobacteraceae bacterium]|nr:hypothetical protein [Ktedonobacteraceae bacterium]
MAHYVKLFESIIHSTLWSGESAATKVVWITMLAMADSEGEVYASIPGLAKAAGVTIPECEAALNCFLSPDPYSRSKEADGRRIEEIQGGWELINYKYYRKLKSAEQEKETNALRQKRHRDRKKEKRSVTESNTESLQEEREQEEEEKINNNTTASATPPLFAEAVNGKKPRKNPKKAKFKIPALDFTEEQETAFDRVWQAWPAEGWDFTNRKAQP